MSSTNDRRMQKLEGAVNKPPARMQRLAIVTDGKYYLNGSKDPATPEEIERWRSSGNSRERPVALVIGSKPH